MAFSRLMTMPLRYSVPTSIIRSPLSHKHGKATLIRFTFKHNNQICARSFGTFTKFKGFLQWFNKPWLRRLVRGFRMISLLTVVGASCYTYGQVVLLDDPHAHQESTRHQILRSRDAELCWMFFDNEDISHAQDKHGYHITEKGVDRLQSAPAPEVWHQLQRVFRRIKDGAKKMLEDEKELLKARGNNGEDVSEELQTCRRNLRSMKNPWVIVLVDYPMPNAFVSGLLPSHVFVTTGLFEHFAKDEAQLALVLGHELSHYLLRHTQETLLSTAIAKGVIVCLIAMIDPSGGLGTVAVELLLPYISELLELAYSRDMEMQADDMGQVIACTSCYSPKDSMNMFENMRHFEEEYAGKSIAMLSSHPVGEKRCEHACKKVEELQKQYEHDSACAKIHKLFRYF